MKWITVKRTSDIQLAGIEIELIWHDNTLKGAILTDAAGSRVKFSQESYSAFQAMVPAPPPTEKRFVLHGDLPTGKFKHAYETRHEAATRSLELRSAFREDVELEIDEIDLPVDDKGLVKDEDIPF